MENETIFENISDTPVTEDTSLDALLAECRSYTDPLEDFTAPVTPPAPRRRDRAAERERKLLRNKRRFFRAYFIITGLLVCALLIAMIPLRNWLIRFETTSPDNYSQQVFDSHFAQQDWGKVYDAAKMEESGFEGREAFIRYMQDKVAAAEDKEISYYETSAGLSTDHKYIVMLGGEKIATFTLSGTVDSKTDKTDWSMTSLQLTVDRNCSIRVQSLPGYTVLVNGKTVSEDYIVRVISTKADDYLPEGVQGYSLLEYYVDGLMASPTVEVLNGDGNAVPTVFSAADNCYQLDLPVDEMTDTVRDIILGAAKANALFAIRAIGTGELSKHFDSSTQIYKDLCNTPTFIQSYASYGFDESVTNISDFYRYNDSLFSARVTLQLDITRKNGTVKSLEMNTTYIFTKDSTGNYKVTNITNVNLQEQVEQVRLSFDCDGTILGTLMADVTAETITIPLPTVPEGKEFLGWASREVADNGQITMNILFVPDESGVAKIPANLEPTTLYAVFGTEGAERND